MVVIMMGRKRTSAASIDGVFGRDLVRAALAMQREVDHHDGVLLDDADQHDHADKGVEAERHAEQHQGDQRAHRRRRQARQNGQRVDEALIENAQDDIDRDDGDGEQHAHIAHRLLERLGLALELAVARWRAC